MIVKNFYKIIYRDDINAPEITPLDDEKIWSQELGGLDKSRPFIVINPGNATLANRKTLPTLSDEKAKTGICFQAKMFVKGVRKNGFNDEMQFLVAVNEDTGMTNMDLIKSHNSNPDGFVNEYTMEQARLIYGPLITENGVAPDGSGIPLDAATIIANLSQARSYNASFGSVTANCQINALATIMRKLKIGESVIKEGIENMRRIDILNVAKISVDQKFPAPSSVIVEGSNDNLVSRYIPEKFPPLPDQHTNMDVVAIDDHRIKVYQKLPLEVYDPRRQITEDQKAQEKELREGLARVLEKRLSRLKLEQPSKGKFYHAARSVLASLQAEKIEKRVLQDKDLLLRIKDPDMHDFAHFTGEATAGNEVEGHDRNLSFRLMADMMARRDAKDVAGVFSNQSMPMGAATVLGGSALQQGSRQIFKA